MILRQSKSRRDPGLLCFLTYQGSPLLLSCEGESGGLGDFLVSAGGKSHLTSSDSSIGL